MGQHWEYTLLLLGPVSPGLNRAWVFKFVFCFFLSFISSAEALAALAGKVHLEQYLHSRSYFLIWCNFSYNFFGNTMYLLHTVFTLFMKLNHMRMIFWVLCNEGDNSKTRQGDVDLDRFCEGYALRIPLSWDSLHQFDPFSLQFSFIYKPKFFFLVLVAAAASEAWACFTYQFMVIFPCGHAKMQMILRICFKREL